MRHTATNPPSSGARTMRRASRTRRRVRRTALVLGAAVLGAVMLAACYLVAAGRLPVPPRTLAPFIQERASGHHPMLATAGTRLRQVLESLDMRMAGPIDVTQFRIGAQAGRETPVTGLRRTVASSEQLRKAIETAQAGDDIVLMSGTYSITSPLEANRAGQPGLPVTVRAERLHEVKLEISAQEGFLVSAPHWRFRDLTLRGVCQHDASCEHAFHVVGAAHHFELSNSVLEDFNSHLKINGVGDRFPDHGLIDGNVLRNRMDRRTDTPVTLVDLVGASDWRVQGNLIAHFVKAGGDGISYGVFAKGAGERNRIERNMIVCETGAGSPPGQRVGMSFGGGGTARQYCRDGRCLTEQDNSSMTSNLVARCSDVGIYLNRAAGIRVRHNTLLDTAGVQVRHPESAAYFSGNLIDGAIASRDDGIVHVSDNIDTGMARLYTGQHPVRSLFANAEAMNLAWRDVPRNRVAEGVPDLCGETTRDRPVIGAFDDFSACRRHAK
jgi:parallel beta-helix repeat protein